jgi:hypothetical protein
MELVLTPNSLAVPRRLLLALPHRVTGRGALELRDGGTGSIVTRHLLPAAAILDSANPMIS